MNQSCVSDFCSWNRLYYNKCRVPSNHSIVKLAITPELLYFVESYEALSNIKNGQCHVVDIDNMR